MDALISLKERDDLVIKKADKGACIVIEKMSAYIENGLNHLADERTYRPLDCDPTEHLCEQIVAYITNLANLGYIDETTEKFLRPVTEVRTQLYFFENDPQKPL